MPSQIKYALNKWYLITVFLDGGKEMKLTCKYIGVDGTRLIFQKDDGQRAFMEREFINDPESLNVEELPAQNYSHTVPLNHSVKH